MISRFLDRARRGPLLLDAAMGTRLIASGLDLASDDPCLWNLVHPEAVSEIHRRDLESGAEAVTTNTFGANRSWLARYHCPESVVAINRQAVALARTAPGPARFLLGSIGPTASDESSLRGQADALLEAGVDALVLETFKFEQAVHALRSLKSVEVPILVGLFAWPDPITATAHRLIDEGASIVGANCFADLGLAFRLIDDLTAAGDGNELFWLKPSTGPPDHPLTAADFRMIAAQLASVGTGLLGGCCGTTEEHLEAIRDVWKN